MAFGNKQSQAAARVGAERLAALSGAGAAAVETAAPSISGRRGSVEPDLARIRPRGVDETDEARSQRLAAKTVNFSATFIARLILMAALAKFGFDAYQLTGTMHRGVALGLLAMLADFGRVTMKAMEPGTK